MNSRILIIDFDAKTLRAWQSLLTDAGYSVGCARTAHDIDTELRSSPPRLVILEPMLPGQDGFDICRKVKGASGGRAPAVIIASRIFKGARYRGMARDAGADMFLEKPVKDEMLLTMVGKFASPAVPQGRSAVRDTGPVAVGRDATSPRTAAAGGSGSFASSHPLAHAPEETSAGTTSAASLGDVSDDDIDGALDRLTFEGGIGLEMGGPESKPERSASTVGVIASSEAASAAPPPSPASRSGPDISEDDLAAALDRLEMSTGAFPRVDDSEEESIPAVPETGPVGEAAESTFKPEPAPLKDAAPDAAIGTESDVATEMDVAPEPSLAEHAAVEMDAAPEPTPAEHAAVEMDVAPEAGPATSDAIEIDVDVDEDSDGLAALPDHGDDNSDDPLLNTEVLPLEHIADPASAAAREGLRSGPGANEGASRADGPDPDDVLGLSGLSSSSSEPLAASVSSAAMDQPLDEVIDDAIDEDEISIPLAEGPDEVSSPLVREDPGEDESAVEAGLLPEPGEKNLDDELGEVLSGESEALSGPEESALFAEADEQDQEDEDLHTGLQGMDRGTAELLSSLEELEGSLPTGSVTGSAEVHDQSGSDEAGVDEHDDSGSRSADSVLADRPAARAEAASDADPEERSSGVAEFEDLEVDHEFAAKEVEPPESAPPPHEMLEEDSLSGGSSTGNDELPEDEDPLAPSMPSADDVLRRYDSGPVDESPSDAAAESEDELDAIPSLGIASGSDDAEAEERYAELLEAGPKSRAGLWIAILVVAVIAAGTAGGIWFFLKAGGDGLTVDESIENGEPSAAPAVSDASEIRWDAGAPPDTRAALRPVPRDAGPGLVAGRTDESGPATTTASLAGGLATRSAPSEARTTLPSTTPPEPTAAEIPEAELSTLDEPLRKIAGTVPAELRPEAGAERAGRVFLNVLVGPDGTVLDAKVVVEPGSGAGNAVRDAVLDWRYSPPRRGNLPVKVWKTEAVSVRG